MKKILLTALLLFTFYLGAAQWKKPYGHVKVQTELQPFFNRFTKLMESKDIPVDYTKISAVILAPMARGIQGYYMKQAGVVIISYGYLLPKHTTKEEDDDLIFLTLAHEIGHSQGWVHSQAGVMGLMHPDARFDLLVVKGMGADQFILNHYTHKFCY